MKNQIDFELSEDAIEDICVGNRAREHADGERYERSVERMKVEGDDSGARRAEARHEAMADFASGPRNQHDRFAHGARERTVQTPEWTALTRSASPPHVAGS